MPGVRRDTWVLFGVCLVAGAFAYLSSLESLQGFGIGPNGYVRLLSGALIALGVIAFVQDAVTVKKKRVHEKKAGSAGYRVYVKIMLLMIVSLLFMFILPLSGFYVSGVILMILSAMIIKGEFSSFKFIFKQLLFSILTMVFIYFAFGYFMRIDLS